MRLNELGNSCRGSQERGCPGCSIPTQPGRAGGTPTDKSRAKIPVGAVKSVAAPAAPHQPHTNLHTNLHTNRGGRAPPLRKLKNPKLRT
ncbi:MAG: hypothetical protein F6J93_09995 [Oscillatoria sp. SIO1A7]|nr:hypothetical protein [Oscillatoria sp. SIO1A7]